MINVKEMLAVAIRKGASDIHINTEMPPIMRINTELVVMDLPEVTQEIAQNMVRMATRTQHTSESVSTVQLGADKTSETSTQLIKAFETLLDQTKLMQRKVDDFLLSVRS